MRIIHLSAKGEVFYRKVQRVQEATVEFVQEEIVKGMWEECAKHSVRRKKKQVCEEITQGK